ncbi:MAG: hypothetical protein OXR73_15355 [Myxococcales bacterium]|nr:hypothetical protein [Myxococcales bacterium]
MLSSRVVRTLYAGLSLLGCAGTQDVPTLSSSMNRPAHAMAYPEQVAATLDQMEQDETSARERLKAFSQYPNQLKDPDFQVVVSIAELADQEGRSQAFVATVDQQRTVRRFVAKHDKPLSNRIAGAVNRATEDKGCNEEVGPVAAYASRRAMTRELNESLRKHNAAQYAISESEGSIGKRNVKALRNQVDAISLTSYMAHVGLDDHRREISRLSADYQDAADTLAGVAADLQGVLDDPAHSPQTKKLAKRRLLEVQASQQRLNEVTPTLDAANQDATSRVEALRTDYQVAIDQLLDVLHAAAEAAAAAAGR